MLLRIKVTVAVKESEKLVLEDIRHTATTEIIKKN